MYCKMRRLLLLLLLPFQVPAFAQDFDTWFEDATLRLDYVFGGSHSQSGVFLDEMSRSDGWYGRRHNLSRPPLLGNGQVYVTDAESGDTIYANSFTSLFLEWIATEESRRVSKCFEHPVLVPMPRKAANVALRLNNAHQDVIAEMSFTVEPQDILIKRYPRNQVLPTHYIGKRRNPRKVIDIAILPEGYTSGEMALFHKDAEAARAAILAHEPFKSMADRFNFVVVDVPSFHSGNSLPREGKWRHTACGSNFDTFYSERYNTTKRLRQVHDLLQGIPYEHILILTNSDTYGGGGFYNDYCIASAHADWATEVIVHEFGHSFAGLGDEYATNDGYDNYYPADREPWEQNITTLHDFASKWQDMLPAGTPVPTPEVGGADRFTRIGVYEGAGYQSKGVYRPVVDCRMRVNEVEDFCPICQRAITRMIRFYTEQTH